MKRSVRDVSNSGFFAMMLVAIAVCAELLPARVPAQARGLAQDSTLEAIVVTAERRAVDVQTIPLQVEVQTGEQLARAGVVQMRDLVQLVPGLNIQQAGPYTQFSIRGIGSVVTTPYGDPSVAFNVDGVYIARPTGTHGTFYDVSRIEVLTGPQGTLYGRNSTAGAINVITNEPVFRDTASLGVDFGNYHSYVVNGMANLSLNDQLALRGAFQIAAHSGYYSDGYDDEKSKAARLGALWNPMQGLSIRITGDYSEEGGRGPAGVPYPYLPGGPWQGQSSPAVQAFIISRLQPPYKFVTPPGRTNVSFYGQQGVIDHHNAGITADIEWDVGFGQLSALGSYRSTRLDDIGYVAGFAFVPDVASHQATSELRLASNDSQAQLQWLVGLYYFDERQRGTQLTDFVDAGSLATTTFGSLLTISPLTDESDAIFTQETYAITDRLRFTAGVRYLEERKENNGTAVSYSPFGPVPMTVAENSGRLKNDATNYKVGLDFNLADNSLLYGYVSDGYKAGGFYVGAAPSAVNPTPNSYAPEKLTAYVIGTKNRFLGGKLQVNLETFYWDYTNRQYITFGPVNSGGPANLQGAITVNVGSSELKGTDLDVSYLLGSHDLLTLSLKTIYDGVNTKFAYASTLPPGPGCRATSPGQLDCSGTAIPLEPKWAGTASLQHTVDLRGNTQLIANVSTRFESRSYLGAEEFSSQIQDGYTKTNVDINYVFRDGRYSVGVYGHNLEDARVRTAAPISPITNTPLVETLPPRTYGARLEGHF